LYFGKRTKILSLLNWLHDLLLDSVLNFEDRE
jgi:hypothetical protein